MASLEKMSGDVTPEAMIAAGLISSGPVKILAKGEIKKGLTVKAHKFSEKAKSAIEKAGGKVEVINL